MYVHSNRSQLAESESSSPSLNRERVATKLTNVLYFSVKTTDLDGEIALLRLPASFCMRVSYLIIAVVDVHYLIRDIFEVAILSSWPTFSHLS